METVRQLLILAAVDRRLRLSVECRGYEIAYTSTLLSAKKKGQMYYEIRWPHGDIMRSRTLPIKHFSTVLRDPGESFPWRQNGLRVYDLLVNSHFGTMSMLFLVGRICS